MRGFDDKFITELKAKNDLVDVVSKYVPLEQRGSTFWGRCPFHHEKTASFSVNSLDQYYYCFGCHKSGDVITFIMEIESLEFNDAVKFLAERAKMPLPEFRYDDEKVKEQRNKRDRLLALLKDTARYYRDNLYSGKCPAHVEYVKKRQLTSETLQKFGFGASIGYGEVVDHLKAKGYTLDEMVESGVCGRSERNGRSHVYDALAGRLIIPTIDQFGNVIAFCGRIIDNRKDVGKYVNTRETSIFSKGKTLFNLNNLKKLKNEKGLSTVIMVEGQMDAISLVQAGFENVVASMGTALTKDQARIVKRYAEKVIISYDGDFAGQKAAIRGLEIFRDEGLDVKVVSLPDGLDPDEVIKTQGRSAYEELLNSAKPLIDFKLDILKKTFDIKTVDGKRKYITEAIKVIKQSPSPAEREDLLKSVRDLTGITYESLSRELYALPDSKPESKEIDHQAIESTGDKISVASRFILASYLKNELYAEEKDINEITFNKDVFNEIKFYILERKRNSEPIVFNDLYEVLGTDGKEETDLIAAIISNEKNEFDKAKYFSDCVKTLTEAGLEDEIQKLIALYKAETDTEKRKELASALSGALARKKILSLK